MKSVNDAGSTLGVQSKVSLKITAVIRNNLIETLPTWSSHISGYCMSNKRHIRLAHGTKLDQDFSFEVSGTENVADMIGCRFWSGNNVVLYATTMNNKIVHNEPGRFTLTISEDEVNKLLLSPERLLFDVTALFNNGVARITKGTASEAEE